MPDSSFRNGDEKLEVDCDIVYKQQSLRLLNCYKYLLLLIKLLRNSVLKKTAIVSFWALNLMEWDLASGTLKSQTTRQHLMSDGITQNA